MDFTDSAATAIAPATPDHNAHGASGRALRLMNFSSGHIIMRHAARDPRSPWRQYRGLSPAGTDGAAAGAQFRALATGHPGRAGVRALAAGELRLPARGPHPPLLQHAGALHVRPGHRAAVRHALL